MSDRVSRLILIKKENDTREKFFNTIAKELDILLSYGYNCFISEIEPKENKICIEFCIADPTTKNKEIPQPCWLFLDELEFLSKYQLENLLQDAKEAVVGIQAELDESANNDSDDDDSKSDA